VCSELLGYQYGETNVIKYLFNLLRRKDKRRDISERKTRKKT
jgi:hypothetical protein